MSLLVLSCLGCHICEQPSQKNLIFHHVVLPKDDDEWDDYRENKKDYTGLKIENLTQEEPKEEEEETEVVQSRKKWTLWIIRTNKQVNEDGEVVTKRKDGKDGPWNKLGDAPSNQVRPNNQNAPGNQVRSSTNNQNVSFRQQYVWK